jgi:hypothetical protein
MAKFLRKERGGLCQDCYYNCTDDCPGDGCIDGKYIFIEDAIIPQKLALYPEMLNLIFEIEDQCDDCKEFRVQRIKSIIDRAKKIEEE